jgi:hypothetical protein
MSSVTRQFFAPADLMMLGRVLDQANLQRSHVPSDREARLDAARFLIARFQNGVTSEAALGSCLSGRSADPDLSVGRPGYVDTAAIFSEYLRTTKSPKIPGLKCRYGKRSGVTGRRTVYRLITGSPPQIQASDMIELNIKTGLGALRMLDSPEHAVD